MHAARVVVGLACLLLLDGCGPQPADGGNGGNVQQQNSRPTDGTSIVRYELTGTAVTFDGSYAEPATDAGKTENMVEIKQAPLPWSKDFRLAPNQLFVAGVTAQGPNLESTVTCKILKNGVTVTEESGPLVDCRAEVVANGSS